jgi:Ni/Co efflux regulator RcnB
MEATRSRLFQRKSDSMKSTAIVCAIAVASLGFSALSFADGNDRHGPREDQYRGHQRYERRDEGHAGRWDDRRFDRYDDRRNDRGAYYNAHGPEFRRGGYVPREFHNHRYVVTDYRAYPQAVTSGCRWGRTLF